MKKILKIKIWSKDGKINRALVVDLGYRIAFLSFDLLLMVELSGKSPNELMQLSIGEYVLGEIKQ